MSFGLSSFVFLLSVSSPLLAAVLMPTVVSANPARAALNRPLGVLVANVDERSWPTEESKNVSATASTPVVLAAAAPPRRIVKGLMAFICVLERMLLHVDDLLLPMDKFIVLALLLIPSPPDAEGEFTGSCVDVAKAMAGQGPAEPSRRAVADVVAAVYKDILIIAMFWAGKYEQRTDVSILRYQALSFDFTCSLLRLSHSVSCQYDTNQ